MFNGIFLALILGGWLAAGHFWLAKRNLVRRARRFAELPSDIGGETHFAALFDHAPMACALLDTDFRITEWNRQAEGLFGLKREDVLGHTMIDVMAPSDKNESAREEMAAFVAQGKRFRFPGPKPADGGETFEVELRTAVLRDGERNPCAILAMAMDVAQSKALQNELRHQTDFQGTLLNALNDVGLQLMMIENGRIIHVGNRELARRFGYTDADLDAHPALVDIVHPDDRARVMDYYLRRLAGEPGPSSYELGLVTREGERREYETAVAIVPGTDPIRIVTIGKDITERKTMEDALRRSRESLAVAQRIALVGSWELDLVSNSLSWSDEIFRIFEIDPERFGASYEAFVNTIHPDDREAVSRAYSESLASREPYAIEHRLLMPDGRIKCVHERCETHYAADGMPLRSLGTVQDISARKQAEQRLREALAFTEGVINAIPDLLFELDRYGTYLNVWAQTRPELLAAQKEALLGKSIADVLPPDAAEVAMAAIREAEEGGASFGKVMRIDLPHGENWFELSISKKPGRDASGDRFLVLSRDVTERYLMEMALATREREFRTLAENSPDSIARYDRGCRFVYVNPAFEKLLGYRLDDLHGRTPTEVPGLPEAGFFQMRVEEVVVTGVADEFEHAVQTADGTAVWGLVSIFPERDETGQVAYVQVLTRDITELKDVQRHLEASRARLRELAVLQNTGQEAERKQLAWDVHEGVGQYLMALRMNLSMLSRQSGQGLTTCQERIPGCGEYIRNMFDIVGKSIQLVREVTEGLRPSVLDSGIVAALEWLGEKFMEDTGIPCELSLPDEDLPMDERAGTMIFRVAEEALANIVRHATPGVVQLTLTQRGGNCYLAVRDDGNGFDLTRLYDNSVAGLAWLQEQIASLGGELNVFSVPGQGTMIEAIVPIRDISEEQ